MRSRGRALVALALLWAMPAALAQERSAHTNFVLRCAGCHGMDGVGSPKGGIPTFPGYVGAFAGDDAGRTYLMHVPGVVSANLSNAEIAEVMNYVMEEWAGESLPVDFRPFSAQEVSDLRGKAVGDVVKYRRQVAQALKEKGIAVADYPWP